MVRRWEGQDTAAVFFGDTVSTHLVNEAAAAILQLASVNPVTANEVRASLFAPSHPVDSLSTDIDRDFLLIDETIIGLVAAGLLRRVE